MARPSIKLVLALRETALRLSAPSVRYEWSHFGHCNCGHLAQTLTGLSPKLIYDAAFQRAGDWGEQAKELAQVDLSVAVGVGGRHLPRPGQTDKKNEKKMSKKNFGNKSHAASARAATRTMRSSSFLPTA